MAFMTDFTQIGDFDRFCYDKVAWISDFLEKHDFEIGIYEF